MEKFEAFIQDYEPWKYSVLPAFMKRRVDALKKLQLEHIKLQHQYNMRIQELELEFDRLHKPLYEKRAKIINGEYEPTDEECRLPANIADLDSNGDQENSVAPLVKPLTDDEEATLKTKVKGLPGFWLGCLNSSFNFSASIEEHDKPVLKYLKDIQLSYEQKETNICYKLEFLFDDNPFFTDKVLTKTYYLKVNPDEKNPFNYDGFEVIKSEGCTINWKADKDVTTKTVTVKQQNKANGKTREKKKEIEKDSFFHFFKPPNAPENPEEEADEELGAMIAVDFELGEMIRQSLIPKASLYYSGYMMDEDDDEEDDDDDDDDSEGFDYDSDEESDADSHESSDSLKKDK